MSWPDDGLPRFVTASVTGYTINPAAYSVGSKRRVMPAAVAVLDRAYAHKVVREFATGRSKGRGGGMTMADVYAEAELFAVTLNASEDSGEMDEAA